MRRLVPRLVAIAALLVATSAHASGGAGGNGGPAATPDREWNFRVLLDGREIGSHRYVLRSDGAATEVESRASFDVRILFLNAYRYRHEARERWRGTCLDRLESRTDTNGSVEAVAAEASGDGLRVAGPSGEARVPGCVMSFAYWNPRILDADRLLNSQTGELLPVRVTDRGTDHVTVAGRDIPATRHRLSAPGLAIDLWYAGGDWVALEAAAAGGRVLRYELE